MMNSPSISDACFIATVRMPFDSACQYATTAEMGSLILTTACFLITSLGIFCPTHDTYSKSSCTPLSLLMPNPPNPGVMFRTSSTSPTVIELSYTSRSHSFLSLNLKLEFNFELINFIYLTKIATVPKLD
jgi:hypothetical protein